MINNKKKIFDCFIYFDEKDLAEIRINILKDYVDYFVICESKQNHRGEFKGLNFPLEKFEKIKEKIIYLTFDNFPKFETTWERQNYQRNYLINGLKKADKNDLVLFSDADEIPNPSLILEYHQKHKDKIGIFIQRFFYYKLNLNVPSYAQWEGTRVCKMKYLKSFTWLRDKVKVKNLRYGFWRFDKYKNIIRIDNGGWHFSFLGSAEFISNKIKSYTHSEFDNDKYTNLEEIKLRINKFRDPFDRDKELVKVPIDSSYPDYIINNKDKFKDLIIE